MRHHAHTHTANRCSARTPHVVPKGFEDPAVRQFKPTRLPQSNIFSKSSASTSQITGSLRCLEGHDLIELQLQVREVRQGATHARPHTGYYACINRVAFLFGVRCSQCSAYCTAPPRPSHDSPDTTDTTRRSQNCLVSGDLACLKFMTNLKLLSLGNCKDCTGSLSSLAGLTSLEMLKLEGVFSLKGDADGTSGCPPVPPRSPSAGHNEPLRNSKRAMANHNSQPATCNSLYLTSHVLTRQATWRPSLPSHTSKS